MAIREGLGDAAVIANNTGKFMVPSKLAEEPLVTEARSSECPLCWGQTCARVVKSAGASCASEYVCTREPGGGVQS